MSKKPLTEYRFFGTDNEDAEKKQLEILKKHTPFLQKKCDHLIYNDFMSCEWHAKKDYGFDYCPKCGLKLEK